MTGSEPLDTRPDPARFDPYVVVDTGRTTDDVFEQVNTAVWQNYGPDFRLGDRDKPVGAPLQNFEQLVQDLTTLPHARFVDHVEMYEQACDPGEIRIAFRHDIDSDIVGAIAQAEIEAEYGVRANWVVLHTALYYGHVDTDSGRFMRNDAMAPVYRRLQDLGHEVSLHTDPLSLYQDHGIDGAQAVTTELAWLRGHGIEIAGTTAHNFRPRYGAENYEVFMGYMSPRGDSQSATATWVEHDGKGAPLRVLDERSLGLRYEGNQILWDVSRQLAYGSVRSADNWYWANRSGRHQVQASVTRPQLINAIRGLELGTDLVLVVHPEYLAARTAASQAPLRHIDNLEYGPSPLGWTTYRPDSIVAVAAAPNPPGSQPSCNAANSWGMLDLPPLLRADRRRVVIVGSANLDGRAVQIGGQLQRRLAADAFDLADTELDVVKLAHPGYSIDRQWAWIKEVVELHQPDVVVLAIDDRATNHLGSEHWPTGRSGDKSKGRYLGQARSGAIKECSYPRQKRSVAPSMEVLAAMYAWVIDWLTAQGVAPVLFAEGPVDPTGPLVRLAQQTGTPLVDPAAAITEEYAQLNLLAPQVWDETAHRVGADSLLATVLSQFGIVVPELPTAPKRPASERPSDTTTEAAIIKRRELGLLDYPVPFAGAIAYVARERAATTTEFQVLMHELVHTHGLDHGDGLPLADHHQRYSGGRRARSTTSRAVLTHDLRRDNAPTSGSRSWLSDVLGQAHRGDIDYLHGLSAWGARSLAMQVRAMASTLLVSPFDGSEVPEIPFALNAADFPIAMMAIELASGTTPPSIAPTDGSPSWPRVAIRQLGGRGALGLYAPPDEVVQSPVSWADPANFNPVVPQVDLPAFRIAVPAADIVSAAAHNLNPTRVHTALAALGERYGFRPDTIVANRHYLFYDDSGLDAANGRLERVTERRGSGTTVALFAEPPDCRAASTIADHPHSAAFLGGALDDLGIRFVAPFYGDAPTDPDDPDDPDDPARAADPIEAVFLSVERSGVQRETISTAHPPAGSADSGTRFASADQLRSDPRLFRKIADAHYGHHTWMTRPSVLANYATALRMVPGITSRSGDKISIDTSDNPDVGLSDPSQLFGLSFAVTDTTTSQITFNGAEIDDLVRWDDSGQITIASCGIRWPIMADHDPVLVAQHPGDLGSTQVEGGWEWTAHGDESSGRLTTDARGVATVRIGLDRLDVSGAQVVSVDLGDQSSPDMAFEVRCIAEGGATFTLRPTANHVATHRMIAPFWAPWWTGDTAAGRSIRTIELSLTGPPGGWIEVGNLWLGRPKARPEPLELAILGGDALGSESVIVTPLVSDDHGGERWECPVEPDGLFVTPRIPPGAYLVAADDQPPRAVQLLTHRFDLALSTR